MLPGNDRRPDSGWLTGDFKSEVGTGIFCSLLLIVLASSKARLSVVVAHPSTLIYEMYMGSTSSFGRLDSPCQNRFSTTNRRLLKAIESSDFRLLLYTNGSCSNSHMAYLIVVLAGSQNSSSHDCETSCQQGLLGERPSTRYLDFSSRHDLISVFCWCATSVPRIQASEGKETNCLHSVNGGIGMKIRRTVVLHITVYTSESKFFDSHRHPARSVQWDSLLS